MRKEGAAPPNRDTSWPFAADTSESCDCGHPRGKHAYPGALGTPCSEPGCWCDTFGVLR